METKQAELFKILGVASRIRIIELLKRKGRLTVSEISKYLDITPSAISQHLKILKYAGLVNNERKGYWIPYEINPAALLECYKLLTCICSCGCLEMQETHKKENENIKERLEFLSDYKRVLQEEQRKVIDEIEKLKMAE